jgi:LuxR family maltose regulon positive regulatory protein
VASILAGEHLALLRSGRLATILHWATSVSDGLLLERPELSLAGALAAGLRGSRADERRRLLAIAERARVEAPERWTPYHEVLRGIAAATWVERNLGESIEQVRRAAELSREGVAEGAVPALASLGNLLFLEGSIDGARAAAEEALARPEIALRPHGHVFALSTLSLVHAEAGEWDLAESEARDAVVVAQTTGVASVASGGTARVALAVALAGQGRLREAEREAAEGELQRRYPGPEAGHLHALLVLAGIRAQRGQVSRAASDLERVKRGLRAFEDAGRLPDLADALDDLLASTAASIAPLAEAPSAAEMAVLELLPGDLSLREIGARLYLSLNTVKTHTRALYRKLGVSSRQEAVVRATALGLVDPGDSPG